MVYVGDDLRCFNVICGKVSYQPVQSVQISLFSFEISNTEMKFELTKSEEDLPFIECDIDSFVEYQFQDFFLSEPKRLKPVVEKVQELINTFIAEIENRNERQVKNNI